MQPEFLNRMRSTLCVWLDKFHHTLAQPPEPLLFPLPHSPQLARAELEQRFEHLQLLLRNPLGMRTIFAILRTSIWDYFPMRPGG